MKYQFYTRRVSYFFLSLDTCLSLPREIILHIPCHDIRCDFMDENRNIAKRFADVETSWKRKGCFHSVGEALTIAILGALRGLKNVCQIS